MNKIKLPLFCPFCGERIQINEGRTMTNFQCTNKDCWASIYFYNNKDEAIKKYSRYLLKT